MSNLKTFYNKADTEKIFFTSDTHFCHEKILAYCKRPFSTIEEHDEEIIKRWNEKVPVDGLVFHLGDVALGMGKHKRVNEILKRLNGKIVLIIGNHDWNKIVQNQSWRFESIIQQANLKIDGRHVILNHYPMLCFSGAWRGENASYQLFGHVHTSPYTDSGLDQERLKYLFPSQYDVGVDNNNFTPVSWNEVDKIIKTQMKRQ